jgi:hypothetical protein
MKLTWIQPEPGQHFYRAESGIWVGKHRAEWMIRRRESGGYMLTASLAEMQRGIDFCGDLGGLMETAQERENTAVRVLTYCK